MQSSPPQSYDGKARAIRELSHSLSHSSRSISPVLPAPSDSNPTQRSFTNNNNNSTSDSWDDPGILHSTQQNVADETNTLSRLPHYPRIRSTAKKQSTWQPYRSEAPNPDTSMVNKEFGDFDQTISEEESMDISIEQPRGLSRSNRSTPAKMSARGLDSLYDITPPATGRSRKSLGNDTGNLRRDAQIRRASRNDMDNMASPRPSARNNQTTATQEPKHTSLAQLHAKVSAEESSMFDERPRAPSVDQTRSTRWGNPKTRHSSLQMDGVVDATPRANTRMRPGTASQNPTAQSFILPDLPNLTELVSGVFEDGTPVFSKTTSARSRFGGGRKPSNYAKVESASIPQEEKVIFAGLQMLQDKVAELERQRAEAEQKIEEQELEIVDLRAIVQAQEKIRSSDSGIGSTDGEGSGRNSWKVEKSRLDATVQTLRTKLERAERKITVVDIEKKRLSTERDNLAAQLGVAFQTCEELKAEKEVLHSENDTLRQEVDSLRADNEALRDQLEHEEAQHREETVQLRRQVDQTENATQENLSLQAELTRLRSQHDQLIRQADQTDNETKRLNRNLQAELNRARVQHDEDTQQLACNDIELRKARLEQAEYARLRADHEDLRAQLEKLKAKREDDLRQWAKNEQALKARVERRDETIQHFRDMTQEHTNEAIRHDNEQLRQELAELAAQHEKDQQQWSHKESMLKRQVSNAKHMSDMTLEILNLRDAKSKDPVQRRSSYRREEDTIARLRKRVQEESRISRANASFQESQIEETPRKPYVKSTKVSQTSQHKAAGRSVSSPVRRHRTVEVESETESTTDISLAPRTNHSSFATRGTASGHHVFRAVVQPPPDPEYTELSAINSSVVANLRRELEDELRAARSASAPLERTLREDTVRSERQIRDDTVRSGRGRDDTVRSVASATSARRPSLPRKSSMKDAASKTNATQFEEDFTENSSNQEEIADGTTNASKVSNTSRRRRSLPEMTSAFILPDLTIGSRRDSTARLELSAKLLSKNHDNDNCTVCRPDATANDLDIPRLVPVSSRMPDDVDATMRPSQSPADALALVVKGLCDERAHLHVELAVARAMLESHDPSLGRKQRLSYEQGIAELLRKIKVKDDQIYNLHDALEGQREEDITEQFVDEVTEHVRQAAEAEAAEPEKKKGKSVTIHSYHDSDQDDSLPWEGFEDTAEKEFTAEMGRVGVY